MAKIEAIPMYSKLNIEGPVINGADPFNQAHIDQIMIDLDGTPNKARLGANAILGVSMDGNGTSGGKRITAAALSLLRWH